jgi:hypothetical protein
MPMGRPVTATATAPTAAGQDGDRFPDQPQFAPGQFLPGGVDQRGQHHQADQVRGDLDVRHTGDQADQKPGDHQQRRGGDAEPAGEGGHHGGHDDEEQHGLDSAHDR